MSAPHDDVTAPPAGAPVPAPGTDALRRRASAPLGPLLVASFLMASANLAVFPLLAEIQVEQGLSTAALGPIAGAAFVASVIAQLLLAPLADRGLERHLLVGGLVAGALSLVAMALSTTVAGMVAARALEGVAFGAFLPATRAIVTRGAGMQVAERLGRLSAAELAGVAVGPLLSAWIASAVSVDASLLAFGVLSLATVPLVVRLPIHRPALVRAPEGTTDRPPRLALDLLAQRPVAVAVLLSVALMIPVGAYDTLWSRFMTDLGASTVLIGVSLAVFALPYIVLASAAGRLADRVGAIRAAVTGMVATSAVMVVYGLVGSPLVVTALAAVESTGQALAAPGAQAAMAHATGEARAGAGQGLAGAMGTLAAGLVAVVAAPVYETGGAAVLFCATAALVLGVLGLAVVLHRGADRPVPAAMALGADAG